jgi:hypothetical protein
VKTRLMIFKAKSKKRFQKFRKYFKDKIEILIIMKEMMMMEVIWKKLHILLMEMNGTIMKFNEIKNFINLNN